MPIDFNRAFAAPPASDSGGPAAPASPSASASSSGSLASNDSFGPGSPGRGAVGGRPAGSASLRNAPARALANSALQALKDLGPRLTPAQRTSIGILENYDTWRTQARTNADMFDAQVLPEVDRETDYVLSRRPSFLLLKPVLTDLSEVLAPSADDMGQPRTLGDRATLTAQVAAAHEMAQVLKTRAVGDAQAGDHLCPLTLQPENFARFLEDNRYSLERIVAHCADLSRTEALEIDLEELALNYLQTCGIEPTGIELEAIPEEYLDYLDGSPVSVSIVPGYQDPQHAVLGDGDSCACLIQIPMSGIDLISRNPAQPFRLIPGLSTEFVDCARHERAAAMFLQHLFSELASIEEKSIIMNAAEEDTLYENRAAIRSVVENDYSGSPTLGDECDPERDHTQRSQDLADLYRVRYVAAAHDESNPEPLVTDPALRAWVSGTEYVNDLQVIAGPHRRLERAQSDVVAAALRATGVFPGLRP